MHGASHIKSISELHPVLLPAPDCDANKQMTLA